MKKENLHKGLALVALTLVSVIALSGSPARASSHRAERELRVIDRQGWRMTVPRDWESYLFGPDSPFIVAYLYAPAPADSAGEASEVADPHAKPPVSVLVSRQSLAVGADFELSEAAKCWRCPPDLQREVHPVDVHGTWGVREDVLRADGSRVWILVVQNECHVYTLRAEAPAADAARVADSVERVLSSAVIARSGKMFGLC